MPGSDDPGCLIATVKFVTPDMRDMVAYWSSRSVIETDCPARDDIQCNRRGGRQPNLTRTSNTRLSLCSRLACFGALSHVY